MAFKERLSEPSTSDKHWIQTSHGGYNKCITISGNSVLPNCTGYAWGRFLEVLGGTSCKLSTSNAGLWYGNRGDGYSRGSKPQLGAVMCWSEVGKAGHVAVVEKINNDGSIVTSESGYGCSRFWTKLRTNDNGRWGAGPTYIFQGFIYNPNSSKGYGGVDDNSSSYDNGLTVPGQGDSSTPNYINPKDSINTEAITPYIATIDTKRTNVAYKNLKDMGVVGVMLYGGTLYDTVHTERKYYRADNLKVQVEQADKAAMPYALYVDVKARTVSEAKKECEQLYYVISKYPPQLGLWLKLELIKSTSINNNILKTYYEYLVEWGLKDKCGLYVTRSQLSKIKWENFYDIFWLWLVDHVKSVDDFKDKILDPEFFMLNKNK